MNLTHFTKARQRLAVIAVAYPWVILVSLFAMWCTAYLILGHAPQPSVNDPKFIAFPVTALGFVVGVLLLGFPVSVVVGLACAILFIRDGTWMRIAWFGLAWAVAVTVLVSDPMQMMTWFFD